MNDDTSYVNAYQPPTAPADQPAQQPQTPPQAPQMSSLPPMPNMPTPEPMMPPQNTPTPPAEPATPPATGSVAKSPVGQALEEQNIFFLLGVEDATADEKEAFLNELQQVIWEDFLDQDAELLITEEELAELQRIRGKKDVAEAQQQEEIVLYLEKLIPDLEEILLEKALELKEDMVRERVSGMREYYADKPDQLGKLDEAERLMDDDQWRDAAMVLNTII